MQPRHVSVIPNGPLKNDNGIVRVDRQMATFIEEMSFNFEAISMLQFKIDQYDFNDYDISYIDNVAVLFIKTTKFKLFDYFRSIFKILVVLKGTDFSYIFFPGHLSLVYAAISLILKKPFALYVRGEYDRGCKVYFFSHIIKFLNKIIIKKSVFVLTTGKLFMERLGDIHSNVEQVSPMIEVSKTDIFESRHYIHSHVIKILFVSRILKEKGIFVLLEALQKLKSTGNRFHFVCVGEGPDFSAVEAYIEKADLLNCTTIVGHISDVNKLKDYYREADIFIMPSFSEGFPRTLYEAMTFGLPIITTFVGSITSLMVDQSNCLKVNVSDVEDLSSKICNLITNTPLCEKLGRNAMATMLHFYENCQYSHAQQVNIKINHFYNLTTNNL